MATDIADCSGTPFNYQPEYDTAKFSNIVPWAALETNISTAVRDRALRALHQGHRPSSTRHRHASGRTAAARTRKARRPTATATPRSRTPPATPRATRTGARAPPNLVAGCSWSSDRRLRRHVVLAGLAEQARRPARSRPVPAAAAAHPRPQLPAMMFQTDAPASDVDCDARRQGCAVPAPGSRATSTRTGRRPRLPARACESSARCPTATRSARSPVRRPIAVLLRQPGRAPDARGHLLNRERWGRLVRRRPPHQLPVQAYASCVQESTRKLAAAHTGSVDRFRSSWRRLCWQSPAGCSSCEARRSLATRPRQAHLPRRSRRASSGTSCSSSMRARTR